MRNTLILGIIPAIVVGIASGWRNAAMLLTGMLISAASIWEWQRLARLISARLDHQRTPMGTPLVVFFFLIRLGVFAAAIYGSLKFIHGSSSSAPVRPQFGGIYHLLGGAASGFETDRAATDGDRGKGLKQVQGGCGNRSPERERL